MGGAAPGAALIAARDLAMAAALAVAGASPVAAQAGRVAFEPVIAVDAVAGSDVPRSAGVWIDLFGALRLAEGLDVIARPVLNRRAFDGQWQTQLYQLGLRYERPGRVGLRVEAGVIPSPIGLGILESRPDANPVVSQHSAYYLPLPRIEPTAPRTFLIAAAYPLGAQVSVSGRGWDARVAMLDSSPARGRSFTDAGTQPRMRNIVAGLGITPRIGLRLGAAVAHGGYLAASELGGAAGLDRDAILLQLEAEWAFRHTRIAAEWVRNVMETSWDDAVAAGGWVEATQTLTPRLFLAARADAQEYRYERTRGASESQKYKRFEAVLGLRVTPDLTLRGGYLGREGYVVSHWDDQVVVSIVWHRKVL
jgi:hypothetical protein